MSGKVTIAGGPKEALMASRTPAFFIECYLTWPIDRLTL